MKSKTLKRKFRVRSGLKSSTRPRLTVFRSNSHIYAQVISLDKGKVLASASDLQIKTAKVKGVKTKLTKSQTAEKVGEAIAVKALKAKVLEVVFDRGAYKYHGRVKALAEAARKAGLKF